MMGVCFLLFGVAFQTISDLHWRVVHFPRQQSGSVPSRAPGAFPIALFCVARLPALRIASLCSLALPFTSRFSRFCFGAFRWLEQRFQA
jgi:hypothetical protein